eukprot:997698-Prymnesium_polylepis.1
MFVLGAEPASVFWIYRYETGVDRVMSFCHTWYSFGAALRKHNIKKSSLPEAAGRPRKNPFSPPRPAACRQRRASSPRRCS